MVRQLAYEGMAFVKKHDLVTVPEIAGKSLCVRLSTRVAS